MTPGRIESPQKALSGFVASHPGHPYANVSGESVAESLDWLRKRVPELTPAVTRRARST